MSLSSRDRAKVNAALLQLHESGIDPATVTGVASRLINMGTPARKAYDTAFSKLTVSRPDLHAPLQRLGQLIDASDIQTVASYNVGLERYINEGDPSALQRVMPTLMNDLRAMAIRTGDAGFADGLPAPAPQATQPSEAAPAPQRPGHGPTGYRPHEARAVPGEQGAPE